MKRGTGIKVGVGAAIVLVAAAAVSWRPVTHRAFVPITGCTVEDGDTLQCGAERVRLMGIDAPEVAGHCRPSECAPGDPQASTDALVAGLKGTITIQRWGTDRYGRTLAVMRADGDNIGCRQIRLGRAIYKPEWDQGDGVHADCPDVARR